MSTDGADVMVLRILSCNRLCRQANPPSASIPFANFWRRAGWPSRGRLRP
jgi:hypothetical protein